MARARVEWLRGCRKPAGERGKWARRLFGYGDDACLGIDIGSERIKVVEASGDPAALRVAAVGIAPTPAGAVQGNAVADAARVGEALRAAVGECGARTRLAAVSIPGSAVMIRRLTLPAVAGAELADRVLYEAGRRLPDGVESVNFDYQVLPATGAPGEVDVLLVAARRDVVRSYRETLRHAGLMPFVVDVDGFALLRRAAVEVKATVPGVAVAYLDVGARHTGFIAVAAGVPLFVGEVPFGSCGLVEALREALGVDRGGAEALLAADELPARDSRAPGDARRTVLDAWANEVGQALTLYATAADVTAIESVWVGGGAAAIPGAAAAIGDRLRAPASLVEPFARTEVAACAGAVLARVPAAVFAVAAGTAMRRPREAVRE